MVNDRKLEEYITIQELRTHALEPLTVTQMTDKYDITVSVEGGGRPAKRARFVWALPARCSRRRPTSKPHVARQGFPDPRFQNEREKEIRSTRGSQAVPVLEALSDNRILVLATPGPEFDNSGLVALGYITAMNKNKVAIVGASGYSGRN